MSMYLRLKRRNQTVFAHCEPSDTFGSLKEKIKPITDRSANEIKFYHNDKTRELTDVATIGDFELESDAVVFFVLKSEGSDAFEDIDVTGFEGKEEAERK